MSDSTIGSGTNNICAKFKEALNSLESPFVVEIGTLIWPNEDSWDHKHWVPESSTYIGTDIEEGPGVDIVSDVNDLKEFEDNSVDAIIATSVWEHLPRPWIAPYAVARVLKPGGILYVETHQTFPLHGYPHDYFRFSTEALSLLFTDAGLTVEAGYLYRSQIIPPREVTRWSAAAENYLNVNLFGIK